MAEQPAQWVEVPMADGSARVDLTRLTDGSVMCCLCFEYCSREQLHREEDGSLVDVCQRCWEDEQRALAARGLPTEGGGRGE